MLQDPGCEPSYKRLRLAVDADVHSRSAEPQFMQSPDVSKFDAATALRTRAAAVCCSCALVRSTPPLNPHSRPVHGRIHQANMSLLIGVVYAVSLSKFRL